MTEKEELLEAYRKEIHNIATARDLVEVEKAMCKARIYIGELQGCMSESLSIIISLVKRTFPICTKLLMYSSGEHTAEYRRVYEQVQCTEDDVRRTCI